MGYFQVRYDSRVVIYDHKMFIRLATALLFSFVVVAVKAGNILLEQTHEEVRGLDLLEGVEPVKACER